MRYLLRALFGRRPFAGQSLEDRLWIWKFGMAPAVIAELIGEIVWYWPRRKVMSEDPKLLTCPFCGCGAMLHSDRGIFPEGEGHRVECEGACHAMTCYWHAKHEAVEAWNKRHEYVQARPISEWTEDDRDVLLWHFPICEPPRVGSPLDTAWPLYKGYYTHWTPLPPAPCISKEG